MLIILGNNTKHFLCEDLTLLSFLQRAPEWPGANAANGVGRAGPVGVRSARRALNKHPRATLNRLHGAARLFHAFAPMSRHHSGLGDIPGVAHEHQSGCCRSCWGTIRSSLGDVPGVALCHRHPGPPGCCDRSAVGRSKGQVEFGTLLLCT